MTDQRILTPAEAVAERIETRRATLLARLPEAPPVADGPVCDGWGLVPALAMDGSGYEPSACLGCALCSTVRPPVPGVALARMPVIVDPEAW